ncbi:UNKNOWN [Stylonychia lemnae]|uniref:Transmembrane protein n=1 Tax=Stylonychia lemnae TaxID=5949 RepID=A0A078BDI7_STYLE|nr:UNKNOWN [Stylonychia lemnae]|eukprot:CDW91653.1 UNKNOWN [Stylonychia lemnae]
MNNNQYYILKYNLKYALNNPQTSEQDKKTIIVTEQISNGIVYSYYIYAVASTFLAIRRFKQKYTGDSHLFQMQNTKFIFWHSFKLFVLYELAEYAQMQYMVQQTQHLVKKSHPLKDNLLEKINEF